MSPKEFQTLMTWMLVLSIFGAIFMFNVVDQETSAEHYDTCKQLEMKFGNPDTSDCIEYINNNPNTTGQDIVDHFNVKLGDALLMKPTTDDTDPALKPKHNSIFSDLKPQESGLSASSKACRQLASEFDISVHSCIGYLMDNPTAIGQDILDHQNVKTIDEILTEPIISSDTAENACVKSRYNSC